MRWERLGRVVDWFVSPLRHLMNVAGGAGCGWCLGALVGAFVAHLTQSDEGGIWWVLHWVVCIAVGGGVGGRLGSGWTRDGEAEVDADSREDRESHP